MSVVKHDQDGKALAGAVFQLWRVSNGTPGLQTGGSRADTLAPTLCTTDAQGCCAYQGLLLGSTTSYSKEIAASKGCLLPSGPVNGPHLLTAANDGRPPGPAQPTPQQQPMTG